jgi:hypothetical protein
MIVLMKKFIAKLPWRFQTFWRVQTFRHGNILFSMRLSLMADVIEGGFGPLQRSLHRGVEPGA